MRPVQLLWIMLVILFGLGLFACTDNSSPPPFIPQSDGAAAEASAGDAGPGDAATKE